MASSPGVRIRGVDFPIACSCPDCDSPSASWSSSADDRVRCCSETWVLACLRARRGYSGQVPKPTQTLAPRPQQARGARSVRVLGRGVLRRISVASRQRTLSTDFREGRRRGLLPCLPYQVSAGGKARRAQIFLGVLAQCVGAPRHKDGAAATPVACAARAGGIPSRVWRSRASASSSAAWTASSRGAPRRPWARPRPIRWRPMRR